MIKKNTTEQKLEQAKKKLEEARAKAKEASRQYDKLISAEKRGRLARAKKNAKFRIGDIIRYRPDLAPILVIAIECYDSGEPTYRGLQVCGGKLTRNIRSTQGFGTQAPYVGGDGKRYPENDWQKVGDCTELRANRPIISTNFRAKPQKNEKNFHECQKGWL